MLLSSLINSSSFFIFSFHLNKFAYWTTILFHLLSEHIDDLFGVYIELVNDIGFNSDVEILNKIVGLSAAIIGSRG